MKKNIALLCLLAVLVFVACSKKATPSADSVSDMLRKNRWKISSGTLAVRLPNGKDTMLNYLNWVHPCHLDDYFVFNSATQGALFYGSTRCNMGEPDSVTFAWNLGCNNNCLSINSNNDLYYAVAESILPVNFDTLSQSPLVLDTIITAEDTVGHPGMNIELDSIWRLQFDSVNVANGNISNGVISNFSQSSFTLYFTLEGQKYPDSTNWGTGKVYYASPSGSGTDSLDNNPVNRADTFKYTLHFTNF